MKANQISIDEQTVQIVVAMQASDQMMLQWVEQGWMTTAEAAEARNRMIREARK